MEIKAVRYGRKFSAENPTPETVITKWETELFEIEAMPEEGESIGSVVKEMMAETLKMRRYADKLRAKGAFSDDYGDE